MVCISNIFTPIKLIIILFITGLICTSIGAIPLNVVLDTLNSASHNTSTPESSVSLTDQITPITLMIHSVFQAIGAILIIGAAIGLVAWIFERDEYERNL